MINEVLITNLSKRLKGLNSKIVDNQEIILPNILEIVEFEFKV